MSSPSFVRSFVVEKCHPGKVAPQIRRSRGGRNTQKQKLRPKQQFPIYESCARSIVHTHTDDDGGDGDSHKHKLLGEGKEGEEEAEEVDGVPTPTLLLALSLSFPLIGDWLRYTWASLGVGGGGMGIPLSESLYSLSPLHSLSFFLSRYTHFSLAFPFWWDQLFGVCQIRQTRLIVKRFASIEM